MNRFNDLLIANKENRRRAWELARRALEGEGFSGFVCAILLPMASKVESKAWTHGLGKIDVHYQICVPSLGASSLHLTWIRPQRWKKALSRN